VQSGDDDGGIRDGIKFKVGKWSGKMQDAVYLSTVHSLVMVSKETFFSMAYLSRASPFYYLATTCA
jgi:hypothetical protein